MSISEEQRKKDPHAGPGESYPLDPEHIKAAWDLAGHAKDPSAVRSKILAYAREHGLMDRLPETARKAMEDEIISKGLVCKSLYIMKAWESNGSTFIEGWVSTEDKDTEKDIVPPEAFLSSMKGYFDRRAPLSSNHGTKSYPVGHLQKSILVRDGIVLKSFEHPTDPADFEHFNGLGTGWYARGIVTDSIAAKSVSDGNIGAFSWIGKVIKAQKLSDGGHKFIEVNPLLESTIAAYPINPNAQITHITNL